MNYLAYLFGLAGLGSFGILTVSLYGESLCLPQWIIQFFSPNTGHSTSKRKNKSYWYVEIMQVPRSWFAHFYAYAVILQLSVFYTVVTRYMVTQLGFSLPQGADHMYYMNRIVNYLCGREDSYLQEVDTAMVLASFLFSLQVTRRVYECYFVSIYSGSKMNVIYYFVGFTHYTGCTFAICSHATRATANSNYFQVAGTLLFLYAWYQQFRVHLIFADLRKPDKTGKKPVSLKHEIPRGGLFEKVSCPHYWVEILVYVALSMIFEFSNPSINSILFWVASNQVVSALISHKWYLTTFPNYPKLRKAIIPYVL